MLTDWQKQIVLGTVLGGSSLVRPPKGVNYYLSMRSVHELWLKYKMAELGSIFVNQKLYRCGNTSRANSICTEELSELQNALYDDHTRTIRTSTLDILRDIGIAIWFLEGGGRTGRGKKNAYINATKFKEDGAKTIQEWFRSVDIPCSINRNKNRLRVLFTVSGTIKLAKLIGHLVPSFMTNKMF